MEAFSRAPITSNAKIRMDRRARVISGERGLYPNAGGGHMPFWIPAPNYYFLVLFFTGILFFGVWAAVYDGADETPWIIAGAVSATFIASFVFFREVILRRVRRRALAARRLSHQLRSAAPSRRDGQGGSKFSLRRNEDLLKEIRAKSDAAKVLGKLADAHKEVFDLCEQYLTIAAAEISSARPGSPRIPAMRKGSKFASSRHRFHMLKWAEIKARSFPSEAGNVNDGIVAAREALDAVDRAMNVYPEEEALIESRSVLRVFLVSARIKNSIESAERASAEGNASRAVEHYQDALSVLENGGVEFSERDVIFERIRSAIDRITKQADS